MSKKVNLSTNLTTQIPAPIEVPKKRRKTKKADSLLEAQTAQVVLPEQAVPADAPSTPEAVSVEAETAQVVPPALVRDIKDMKCEPNRKLCEAILANAKQTDYGVTYAMIPIEQMDLDYSYQRKDGKYKEIAAAWDPMKCDAPIVNYRNDRFYVIDGQNRMKAAYMRGFSSMYCLVYVGLTQEEEALRFARQDELSTNVTSKEKLNAFIAGKDPVALDVQAVCDEKGVRWYKRYAAEIGALGCPNLAYRIVRLDGADTLRDIFDCIRHMGWHDWPHAYSDTVVRSLRNVLIQWGDKELVCNSLSHLNIYMPKQIIGLAQVQYINARGTTEAVVKYFNSLIEGKSR